MVEDSVPEDEIQVLAEKVIRSLHNASTDREAVTVTAAFLTDGLRSRLENFLVDNKEIQLRIFDPMKKGALSEFAPMADMAYLLGLIPELLLRWLKLMANVRNIFAHNWLIASFEDMEKSDDENVKQQLKKLRDFVPDTRREDVHSLRQAYEILITAVICGLYPLMKSGAIEHLPERKFPFEVGNGEKDWESVVKNILLENTALFMQIIAKLQESDGTTNN